MLSIAATFLAAASAATSPALTSTSPWWEKITYTISSDGTQESCRYESSISAAGAESCDSEEASSPIRPAASSSAGGYTKITIERRFTPGSRPDAGGLEPGDTLIGGQVMALAIDANGAVRSCQVVAASSSVRPVYGCEQARAERFEASAGRSAAEARTGFLTIIVYGHQAQVA